MITLTKLRPYTGDLVAPSPNHGARRAPVIRGIVLHATADEGDEASALSWLRSPRSRASCHLLVSRGGRVTRLVGDQQRAWHAAGARWRGTHDVNSVTLGIEIANRNDGEPFTDAQYGRVAAIVAHYCRQGLALDDVVGHGDIAASSRTDPLGWDWERFRGMVQHQLRAGDAEGRRSLTYDRRSMERIAAEEAAAFGSTDSAGADDAALADEAPLVVQPSRPVELSRGAATTREAEPDAPAASAAPAADRRRATPARQRSAAIAAPKPVLRSRTIWVNGLTALAAASVLVGDTLDLAFSVGITLPKEITTWALFFIGLVNILLRFRTTRPIGGPRSVPALPPEVLEERRRAPR